MESPRASRTAVLVCQGRAYAAGGPAVGGFSDPVAVRLLRDDEQQAVQRALAPEVPQDVRQRLTVEAIRAVAEGMIARTVTIDEAVRRAGHRQVVILGAGMDSRPWRLTELANAVVFAVDHPASQAEARDRAAGLLPLAGRLKWVPADLRTEALAPALARAGHDVATPTTWVWEGVVPYLAAADVRATLAALIELSAPGSVVVVQYQARSWTTTVGRRLARLVLRLTGVDDPMATEPWLSLWTPDGIRRLLTGQGLAVDSDEDLLTVAERIGSPATHRRSLATGRIAVAHRP